MSVIAQKRSFRCLAFDDHYTLKCGTQQHTSDMQGKAEAADGYSDFRQLTLSGHLLQQICA